MIPGDYHGDEPEIEADYRAQRDSYDEEHSCDYKYTEEWLNGYIHGRGTAQLA
jgi:hypothetical protein